MLAPDARVARRLGAAGLVHAAVAALGGFLVAAAEPPIFLVTVEVRNVGRTLRRSVRHDLVLMMERGIHFFLIAKNETNTHVHPKR